MPKTKNKPYPKYLDALLTRTFSMQGSRDYERANDYIERVNKKINLGDGKVSPTQK